MLARLRIFKTLPSKTSTTVFLHTKINVSDVLFPIPI